MYDERFQDWIRATDTARVKESVFKSSTGTQGLVRRAW